VNRQQPKNIGASVRTRLLARSRETGEDFQFLLQRYAAERFLYRLGESIYRERYVLKGATLFALWGGSIYRGTRDLDFTGYGSNRIEDVLTSMRDICAVPDTKDGLAFDPGTLTAEPIRDSSEYHGLRIRFRATLAGAHIPMQIDIGFGNAIEPPATDAEYPTLLDAPCPRIRAYPVEAVVAEKMHAMVVLGERNSRLKDFYDIYVLACRFEFDGVRLARAIAATFERRLTPIGGALPVMLTARFYDDETRARQWRTYLERNQIPGAPTDWVAVGELLQAFLTPPWHTLADGHAFSDGWSPGGPWTAGAGVASLAEIMEADAPVRRFKPYPAYRDSGCEWLGQIPAHWAVKRLKTVARLHTGGTPSGLLDDAFDEDGIPWVKPDHLLGDRGITNTDRRLAQDAARALGTIRAGSALVCGIGSVGKTGYATNEVCTNQQINAIVFQSEIGDRYGQFAVACLGRHFSMRANKVTIPICNKSEMGEAPLCVPTPREQGGIAAFLDRETARIDALLTQKEKLIGLLQEQRTALITRAVTKGLDPNAPMKDSGIEWLGEIPAHWQVTRLKHIAPVQGGYAYRSDAFQSDGVPVVRMNNLKRGSLDLNEVARIPPNECIDGYSLSEGDLLFGMSGSLGETGSLGNYAVVRLENLPCQLNQRVGRFRVSDRVQSVFLLYFIAATPFTEPLIADSTGTAQFNISPETVGRVALGLPSTSEQVEIVAFLDRETSRTDALVSKVRGAIDRLKEFRTALISAAVTGKIDVRGEIA
jgi:type I restriction enzyme S subunit